MIERSSPYQPAISSTIYPIGGGQTVTLLPMDPYEDIILRERLAIATKLPDDKDVPIGHIPMGALWTAIILGMTWDDPRYRLQTAVPDAVLELSDADLVALGRDLLKEIGAARRVMNPNALVAAALKTREGLAGN